MNVSKSVFVVLLMSIVSMLMLASIVSATPPTISLSGTPATAVPSQSFTVTITASDVTAGQFVSTVFLSNSQGWATSPSTSVACNVQSCSQSFTLTVPAAATNGLTSTLTATANNNLGEVSVQSQATVTVVSGVPPASGNPAVSVSGVTSNAVPGTSFKINVAASDTAAGHVVSSITLTNTRSWSVQPSNTVSCGQQVCSADFTVAVPAGEIVGTVNTFTATATNNVAGGSASASSATTVSATPSIGILMAALL